jgi:hypothetical protein
MEAIMGMIYIPSPPPPAGLEGCSKQSKVKKCRAERSAAPATTVEDLTHQRPLACTKKRLIVET